MPGQTDRGPDMTEVLINHVSFYLYVTDIVQGLDIQAVSSAEVDPKSTRLPGRQMLPRQPDCFANKI